MPDYPERVSEIIAACHTAYDRRQAGAPGNQAEDYLAFHRWMSFCACTGEKSADHSVRAFEER